MENVKGSKGNYLIIQRKDEAEQETKITYLACILKILKI